MTRARAARPDREGDRQDTSPQRAATGVRPPPGVDLVPGDLLRLQRVVGNAAVEGLLHTGGHILVQRRSGTSVAQPSGPSCPTSSRPPPEVGTAVIFATGGSTVEPDLERVIDRFFRTWDQLRLTRPGAVGDELVVDGYGSVTGPAALNRRLSCERAEAVRAVLVAKGVPAAKISVFAHGPTSVFDPAPLRNQRAVISPAAPVPSGYRGTTTPAQTTPGVPMTFAGLGTAKAALTAAGGTLLDLAVAMLETEHMNAADYPLGDSKIEDAANFGIFKQNWHYIRTSGAMPPFPPPPTPSTSTAGLGKSDWMRGTALNTDLDLDVRVLHASQATLGLDRWFAAHRQGETGELAFLAAARRSVSPADRATLSDIANYRNAVEWIHSQLVAHPTLQTDDHKVFVQVPPV